MALLEAARALWHGKVSDAANFLFVSQADVDAYNATTQQLIDVTNQEAAAGYLTEAEKNARIQRITTTGSYADQFKIPDTSPLDGFAQGLQEGQANIKTTLSGGVNFALGSLPWQVWAILGVVLAAYLLPLFLTRK